MKKRYFVNTVGLKYLCELPVNGELSIMYEGRLPE